MWIREQVVQGPTSQRLFVCIRLLLVSWLALANARAAESPRLEPDHFFTVLQAQGQGAESCASTLVKSLDQSLSRRDYNQARADLANLIRCPDLDSDLLFRAGVGLSDNDLYPEAAQVFGRCTQDYPLVFECHFNLALTLLAQTRPTEALAALTAAPRGLGPQELARQNLEGKIYESLDRTNDAEMDLRAAFSAVPQNEDFALDLGLFYIRQRKYQMANTVFDRGAHYHPRSPFLMLGISLAQFMGGQEAESISTCKALLAIDPDFAPARLLLAFALYLGGHIVDAEKTAHKGLEAGHPNPYLYYLDAAALLKLQSEDYDRMLRDLALAREGIPRCTLCYLAEGKVYQASGNSQAAIADFEKAVSVNPQYSEAWYRLAGLYERVGRSDEASRCYAQFRKSKSDGSSPETEMIRNLFAPKPGKHQ